MKNCRAYLLAGVLLFTASTVYLKGQGNDLQKGNLAQPLEYEERMLTLPFDDQERPYMVQKIGHYYVLNGDIIVGDDLPRPILNQRVVPAIAGIPSSVFLWPNGRMPIELDPNVYEFEMEGTVRAAVAEINTRVNNICLVNRAGEPDYVRIQISTTLGNAGGISAVGRQGGAQTVWIAPGQAPSVIVHELLHAMGFYHEQSRIDRGNFVQISWPNVQRGQENNFQIEWGSSGLGTYDYCSIMHYGPTAFSVGTMPTITCLQNGITVPCPACMGTSPGLSAGDIAGINTAYQFAQRIMPCNGRLLMEPQWVQLGGATFADPAIVDFGVDRLAVLCFGTNGDIYQNVWNGLRWSDWSSTGWGTAPTRSQIKMVSRQPGVVDAFVVGANGQLYHSSFAGSGWSKWTSRGGTLSGEFDVVSWGGTRLDVFARYPEGGMGHAYYEGAWSGWETVASEGIKPGAPLKVVSWGLGRLDILAIKVDNTLHHLWYQNGWGSWEPMNATIAGKMTAASFAADHLDIFGEGPDGDVVHLYWDRDHWSDWHSLGGKVAHNSGMDVVAWGGNRLDLFVKGTDGALCHAYWSGSNHWSAFERLGGRMLGAPLVASWGPDRLDIVATSEQHGVMQMFWNGMGWGL